MKKVAFVLVGLICVLLGGLWLLQGLGMVRMQPVVCVAACTPIEGPAPIWAAIGFALAAAGCLAILHGLKPRT